MVAARLVRTLADRGYTEFSGVPCSMLKGIFEVLESSALDGRVRYFPAPREDTALGVASGLTIAGRRSVVLMQNSGLGYGLNVLTSFNLIYGVHLPLVVSWRGFDENDAVEHEVIGRELITLLDVLGLPWTILDGSEIEQSVDRWLGYLDEHTSVLIVRDEV
ncbi:thiamine pyrophosphate-binding protein [Nonomuraea sp. CA-141351]|uniref:thiamine pyrophosphate-binding protein n=1 Tax=Nonomuraea sp. CA-141351 TaxID=3239996 RepID=UPI003D8F0E86